MYQAVFKNSCSRKNESLQEQRLAVDYKLEY